MDKLEFLPQDIPEQTTRWDHEWMHYFSFNNHASYIKYITPIGKEQLEISNGDLLSMDVESIFKTTLYPRHLGFGALNIWVPGKDLLNKTVLEIGCGCGLLGKQLGSVCSKYIGLDYSKLALTIARGVSPVNCQYAHLGDRDAIRANKEVADVMIGRHFFIHQNFENALWVIELGKYLLKRNREQGTGRLYADFFWPDPQKKQYVVYPAKHELDQRYPSCMFMYTDDDVMELASQTGVQVEDICVYPPIQRKFVTFTVN